jgi:hypothetical protein
MNRPDTNELIAALSGGLQPVRRLRPPLRRAASWLLLAALLAAWPVAHYSNLPLFLERADEPRQTLELAATLLTGIVALFGAFALSVPGYSSRWALAPLPPLLLWIAASGYGCLPNGWGAGGPGGGGVGVGVGVGASRDCFVFIVLTSVPLSALLFWALRRARPIAPLPVALSGALGVAALAAFLLQFFHPFDVTVIDLALHLAAVGVIALLAVALRRPLLGAS